MPSDMTNEFYCVAVGTFGSSDVFQLAVLESSVTMRPEPCAVMEKCASSDTDSMDVAVPDGSMAVLANVAPAPDPSYRGVKKSKNKKASTEAGRRKARRSTRLATKKARVEEQHVRRKLKGLKGIKRLYEDDDDEQEERDIDNLTEEDRELVSEGSANFVNHLGKQDHYHSYPLPQVCASRQGKEMYLSDL